MKSKYKRYNIYIRNEYERNLLIMRQELSLRTDLPTCEKSFTLMKIKRHNINKAMKRLQLYKARKIEIHMIIDKIITEEYNEHKNV